MAFTIKNNFEAFINELNNRKSELNREARLAMVRGMRGFEAKIVKDYYSGRMSPSVGLNRQSGMLARAFNVTTLMTGQGGLNTTVRLSNSEVYGRIHEYGGTITAKTAPYLKFKIKNPRFTKSGKRRGFTSQWVQVKSVFIPRRTYVRSAFALGGMLMIKYEVSRTINRILRTRAKGV